MEPTRYIWQNGTLVSWQDATVHLLSHTLHYGGGVFEGIRVYKTDKGPAIFRLQEHIERLFYSAGALQMEIPYSVQQLCDATVEVVAENELSQGYIRPICFFGYGVMGLNPLGAPIDVAIACWPWGAYLPVESVDLKISSYIRIHPRSTVSDAKITGHYVNSILAVQEIRNTHYHEALFLDAEGNIAEGPGENIFFVKDDALHTPSCGSILPGITRATAIEVAQSNGWQVHEREIAVDELGDFDDAFFTGTAAEITHVKTIDDQVIGDGSVGKVTSTIRSAYLDAVLGRSEHFERWLTYV